MRESLLVMTHVYLSRTVIVFMEFTLQDKKLKYVVICCLFCCNVIEIFFSLFLIVYVIVGKTALSHSIKDVAFIVQTYFLASGGSSFTM